ncbi:MAG: zinc ABC transporter substrate-binding protein [Planctomycetes bacterium]|nr:zinc ABC transporter substrate-binding protein [Planctomycetota bacterium]
MKLLSYFFVLLALVGCGSKNNAKSDANEQLQLWVSIAPQAYLVLAIGGHLVNVDVLLPEGKDIHLYSPSPKQIMSLAKADLYFTVGLPFERSIQQKLSGQSQLKLIDCTQNVKRRFMKGSTFVCEHGHEHTHNHAHGEQVNQHPDPHVWLGVEALKKMSESIYLSLAQQMPQNENLLKQNYQALIHRLEKVDAELKSKLAPFKGKKFLVFHPAFGYFADNYDLEQMAVEVEGKSPSARQMTELIGVAKQERIRVVFVQKQFDRKSSQVVAQGIGGSVVPLDPLAGDVLSNLKAMGDELHKAFVLAAKVSDSE